MCHNFAVLLFANVWHAQSSGFESLLVESFVTLSLNVSTSLQSLFLWLYQTKSVFGSALSLTRIIGEVSNVATAFYVIKMP